MPVSKPLTKQPALSPLLVILGSILLIVICLTVVIVLYFDTRISNPFFARLMQLPSSSSPSSLTDLTKARPSPTPILTPTPTRQPRPIPSGKTTFTVSSGRQTGPLFQTGTIDPLDPKRGTPQTISISIVSKKPVTTVKLTMETDTKSKEMVMNLTSGTATQGVWAATWTVDDTYLYTYNTIFTASDGQESNTITDIFR